MRMNKKKLTVRNTSLVVQKTFLSLMMSGPGGQNSL